MSNRSRSIRIAAAAAAVFFFFTLLFLAIQFSGPQLSSHEDPAYHVGHAVSYITGETWQFPVYSTMSTQYVDHYYLYHRGLALFINLFGFDVGDYVSLIKATKIFHSLLSALVFTLFFLILVSFVARESRGRTKDLALLLPLVGTVLLFIAVPSFVYRLYLYRPHIISIMLVLGSLYFCYRRSVLGVAVVSFLAPLFYSLALLVLIPPFFYVAASFLYDRAKMLWRQNIRFFAAALCSLGLGIVLRPDPFAYVYNALYIQLYVLYNYFFRGIDRVGELLPEVNDTISLKIVVFIFAALCVVLYARMRSAGAAKTLSFGMFFLFVLSQALFIPMIFISRISEYAIPVIFLFLMTSCAALVRPFLDDLLSGAYDRIGGREEPNIIAIRARGFMKIFLQERRLLSIALAIFLAINIASTSLLFAGLLKAEVAPDLYRGAAEFLRDHSEPGDIVFLQRADMYPQLSLFNQKNRFTVGMADTFTYAYDPGIYWLWKHITKGEALCFEKTCDRAAIETYEALRDVFKAKYVFMDMRREIGGHLIDSTPEFARLLLNDPRYERVFVDPRYPQISVFKLL